MTEYKVYKMINDDMPGLVYYGSTSQKMNNRFLQHKSNSRRRCSSKKLFEIGEPKMIQLSVFDNELDMYKKEKEYIVNNECLNVGIPSIKKKDYSKGKIYKIVNDDFPDLVYYGSTIQTLKQRFRQHKKDLICAVKKIFETDNCRIELVEDYSCETKRELEIREKHYILNFECINIQTPVVSKEETIKRQKLWAKNNKGKRKEQLKKWRESKGKEYIQKHIEKHNKYSLEYYHENKKKIMEQRKITMECDCGGKFRKHCKKRHERSKKHKNYLDTL